MRHLDLFSGIGCFALAARNVGWETVGFCEIDPYCQKVLAKHWPNVPIHSDIKELTGEQVGPVDIITGGFPCQDISVAGKAAGIEGSRSGLWSEQCRLIDELRPRYAVMENVSALLGRGMGRVLGDLAEIGYNAEWHCISAAAIGCPQLRDRVWIIAYPASDRMQRFLTGENLGSARQGWTCRQEDLPQVYADPFGRKGWPQPLLRGSDNRPAHWVDRLRALGNAIVPQVAEMIFRAIIATKDDITAITGPN